MKKLVLICFLSIVSMLNYLTFAQNPQCCFWLENENPALSPDDDYSLNASVYQNEDIYTIHFANDCNLPLDTKVSLDWEVWCNGVKLDGNLWQYAEVYIEPFFTDLGNLPGGEWVATESLRTGSGLTSSLDQPARTDWPGAIPYMGNGQGYLTVGPQSYNYIYLHYLLYASQNDYLRLRIKWLQFGDYQIVLKLMSRTGGTDIENYYDHVGNQHLYYGGHQSILGPQIGTYTLNEMYRPEWSASICGGEDYAIGIPVQHLTANPVWPNPVVIRDSIPFYSQKCFGYTIDSIVDLTLTVYPVPPVPVVADVDICGLESVTLTITNVEDGATYYWYEDATLTTLLETGATYSPIIPTEGQVYTYYVVAVSGEDCASAAEIVTVTSHTIPVVTLPDVADVCPITQLIPVTANVDPATYTAPLTYAWIGTANNDAAGNANISITEDCGDATGTAYPYSLIVTDAWGCQSQSVSNSVTAIDVIAPQVTPANIDLSVEGCGEASLPTPFANVADIVAAGFTYIDNCDLDADDFTVEFDQNNSTVVVDCNYKIIRLYILKDHCGNSTTFTHTVTITDTQDPTYNGQTLTYIANTTAGCTYRIPSGLIESIRTDLEVTDNCTTPENLNITLDIAENEVIVANTVVTATITDVCGNDIQVTVNVNIPELLTATIDVNPTSLTACSGETFDFTVNAVNGTTPYSYTWNSVDVVATDNQATVVPTMADVLVDENFSYAVVVTDANGCTFTANANVTAYGLPAFDLTNDLSICRNETATLTATPTDGKSYSFLWSNDESTATINVSPNTTTTYTVTLTNNNTGCFNTASVVVTVNQLPVYTYEVTPVTNCVNPNGVITFTTDEENIEFIINGNVQVSPYENLQIGSYNIVAHNTVTGCNSLPVIVEVLDARDLPVISAVVDPSEFCLSDPTDVTITITSDQTENVQYQIESGISNDILTVNNNIYTITTPGTYTYECTVLNLTTQCESAISTVTVQANPIPQNLDLLYTGANTVCAETEIVIYANYDALPFGSITEFNFSGESINGPFDESSTNNSYRFTLPSPLTQTSYTYTLTVTTDAGCTATTTSTFVINPLPQILNITHDTECPNTLVSLEADVQYGSTPYNYFWNPVAVTTDPSDNSQATLMNTNCATHTDVTLQVIDNLGCASQVYNKVVNAIDTTKPQFVTFPQDATVDCQNINNALLEIPTYSDNCTGNADINVNYSFDVQPGNCVNEYVYTRTWIITDLCNNSTTYTQTLTVQDITNPIINTVPANFTIQCFDVPAGNLLDPALTAWDNCSAVANITFNYDDDTIINQGNDPQMIATILRKWYAIDECGNQSQSLIQFIYVKDTIAPVFANVPTEFTADCDNISDPLMPNTVGTTFTVSDDCDQTPTVTYSETTTLGACPNTYTLIRTWTAVDDNENTTIATQTVNVQDITAPVLISAAPTTPITVSCEENIPEIPVLSYTDNCSNPDNISVVVSTISTQGTDPTLADYYNYNISRTWTVTDECGNTAITLNQIINVQDVTAPTYDPTTVPADITLNCNDAIPTADVNAVSFDDNCAAAYLTYAVNDVSTQDADATVCGHYNYIIVRTWTATDPSGNFITVSQTITVQDITAPEVITSTIPSYDASYNCDDILPVADNSSLTFVDLCTTIDPTIHVSYNEITTQVATGCNLYSYTVIRTWTATDVCGNVSNPVSLTFAVIDQTIPVVDTTSIPNDITINCNDIIPAPATVLFTDNCTPVAELTIVYNQNSTQETEGCGHNNYTLTRTWYAEDLCGNQSAVTTQIITVQDVTAPTFTAPADITIYRDNDCNYDVDVLIVGDVTDETDNCYNTTLDAVYSDQIVPSALCPSNLSIIRTWTLEDVCGNAATPLIQTITVEDIIAPTFTVPVGIAICRNTDGTYDNLISSALLGEPTNVADNCSPLPDVTFVDDFTNVGSISSDGYITRTWTVTDECGNVTSQDQVITVNHLPEVTIDGSNGICYNGTENLTAMLSYGDVGTYLWSTGETTQTITISAQGTYYVTVTGVNGCEGEASIVVTEYEHPSIISTVPVIECEGETVTIYASATDAVANMVSGSWDVTAVPAGGNQTFVDQSSITFVSQPLFVDTYFALEFTDNIHNCTYFDTTDVVVISGEPFIRTYIDDENGNRVESDSISIHSGEVLTYYVKVFACSASDNLRTTLEYSNFFNMNGVYTPIVSMYDYLNTTQHQILYSFDIASTYFYSDNTYHNELSESTFPYATSSSTPATGFTPNGGTTYFNWFYLHFFNDRYITVIVDKLEDEGDYRVDYQLVTRNNQAGNPCGSQQSVLYNPSLFVGGLNFEQNIYTTIVLGLSDFAVKHFYINVLPSLNPVTPSPVAPTINSEESIDMSLYPNPSRGEVVNLSLDNVKGKAIVRVLSLNGKILGEHHIYVNEDNSYNYELILNQYVPGIYFIQLINEDAVLTKKLVIQK